MIQIKRASEDDAIAIALLGRITFSETFEKYFENNTDLLEYLDKTFSVGKITNSLKKQNNIFWIALYDGLPIGYAKLKLDSASEFVKENHVCQLQKIYLLKDFIATGAGSLLNETLINKAVSLNYEYIWLSVLKSNQRAVRFYEKARYTAIGVHTFQIGSQVFSFMAMGKKLK